MTSVHMVLFHRCTVQCSTLHVLRVRVVCTYTAIRILVHVVSSDHLTNHLPLSMVAGQQEAVQATLCRQTQEQRRKEAEQTATHEHNLCNQSASYRRQDGILPHLPGLDYCTPNIFQD